MKIDITLALFPLLAVMVLSVVNGVTATKKKEEIKAMQADAVSIGAAEWAIDNKTGHTTFKWKYPQQGE